MKTKKPIIRRGAQLSRSAQKATVRRSRPFYKRLLLHPFSAMLLLCSGVIIGVSAWPGLAETLLVTATVHAPLPSTAAVITSPRDQEHFTQPLIDVYGTCPDASYVKLYRQEIFSGVAQCNNQSFHIQTTLILGANRLQVRVFNYTDDEGPASPAITVYYDQPGGAGPSGGGPLGHFIPGPGGATPATPQPPLIIHAEYHYQARLVGKQFRWNLSITGGRAPYNLTIIWGDRRTSEFVKTDSDTFVLKHTFDAGAVFEPFIRVTDSQGELAALQLSAVVKNSFATGVAMPTRPFSDFLDKLRQYLWLIWPAYAIVVLMAISFWLGETEALKRKSVPRRLHRSHPKHSR